MKITKLVILFNYEKILLGVGISILLFIISTQVNSNIIGILLQMASILILINIVASLIASYILYDRSDLYKLNKLNRIVNFKTIRNAVLVHASFDPLSRELEKKYPELNIKVCDIYRQQT